MSATTPTGSAERNISMAFDLAEAIVDDPSILERIPEGATVVLIPDQDPALAEQNIQMGLDAIRAGKDVFYLHVPERREPTK